MALPTRPLSPHLQIYRPQLTSMLSVLHRASGLATVILIHALVVWLIAIASGPDAFAAVSDVARSWPGRMALTAGLLSVSFHMFNCVRHLLWDMGLGLDLDDVYRSGWAALAGSTALFIVVLIRVVAGSAP